MFSHLIFDIDGTLMDSMPFVTKAYLEACAAVGVAPNREAFLVHAGIRTPLVFKEYYHLDEEDFQKASAAYGKAFRREGRTAVPFLGIEDLIRELEAMGVGLCIATARTREAMESLFGDRELWTHFSYFSCSAPGQEHPRKRDGILACAQHMGVPPGECLMIGDRYVDIQGAKEAGALSCGVTYGFGSRAELADQGADYLVDSVEELRELLLEGKR
jgi:phosphoglycolate phosphatase